MNSLDRLRQRFASLSPRQKDISLRLAAGLTNVQIGQQLGVTVHTIKAHRAEIVRRMEAATFAELVTAIHDLHPDQSPSTADALKRLQIIVVEDDQWYREYLTESLNERAFDVIGVANSAEFHSAWATQPADIVILDIELGPDQEDGLAIATDLRSNSRCGIVMVTARSQMDDRLTGLEIGADAYFSKPVNINELATTLVNLGRRLHWRS